MYDKKHFKSARFHIPVISVGNLSVGGTGKSPHIEYLISLFQPHYHVGILSRGFGREGREYEVVEQFSTALKVGDEPLMFKLKHPNTAVSVGIDRIHCIPRMVGDFPSLDVILLDDAYQHRAVRPGLSILLTDFNAPFYEDYVLPAGRLRERKTNYNRADIIIVTKCPSDISEETKQIIGEKINPLKHQHVYFSTVVYGKLYGLFPELNQPNSQVLTQEDGGYVLRATEEAWPSNGLLVSGIANPLPLENYLRTKFEKLYTQQYTDHHKYDTHDMEVIKSALYDIGKDKAYLVTTEKDAVRFLAYRNWFVENKIQLYVQSMQVQFLGEDKAKFEKDVFAYIKHDLAKYKPVETVEGVNTL